MEAGDDDPVVYRLSEMSGYDFEEAVETLFDRLGYRADVTEEASDFGRDVIARSSEETLIVECKNHESSVGRPVVQKLHSATVSFHEEARGLIVCPGGFSQPAREHANKLGDEVRLWGFSELVSRGRTVDLYFVKEEAGTEYVFGCRTRDEGDLEELFGRDFLGNLRSRPREVERVANLRGVRTRRIPALRVSYELDERFGTSTYPNLYRASERGRRILVFDRPDSERVDLRNWEREFWARQSFDRRCSERVEGKPPAAHFGIDPSEYEQAVRREVARRNSKTVRYTGRNNQTYTKECNVDLDDVSTETIQVFLVRQTVDFEIGPREPRVTFTGAADARPKVVTARSVAPTEAVEVWRGEPATLCNDCAAIETPAGELSPASCERCSRTLCTSHHWDFPSMSPWSNEPYCHECYAAVADEHRHLQNSHLHDDLATALAVLGAPAGLFAEGYRVAGLFVGLVSAAAVVVPVAAKATGTQLQLGIFAAVFVWLAAAVWILFRARRVRRHLGNVQELEAYQPEWEDHGRG